MYYIPDPMEIMDRQMERQMDLVDKNGTYPCIVCGRRFDSNTMFPISRHPCASLECGREDCEQTNDDKYIED